MRHPAAVPPFPLWIDFEGGIMGNCRVERKKERGRYRGRRRRGGGGCTNNRLSLCSSPPTPREWNSVGPTPPSPSLSIRGAGNLGSCLVICPFFPSLSKIDPHPITFGARFSSSFTLGGLSVQPFYFNQLLGEEGDANATGHDGGGRGRLERGGGVAPTVERKGIKTPLQLERGGEGDFERSDWESPTLWNKLFRNSVSLFPMREKKISRKK